MRSILMSAMFIVVIIVVYMNTIGGEMGAKSQLKETGEQINYTIEKINMYGQDL